MNVKLSARTKNKIQPLQKLASTISNFFNQLIRRVKETNMEGQAELIGKQRKSREACYKIKRMQV